VSARLYANLGRALHLEGGCLEEGEQFLRRSLDLNPDNSWAWSWLGLVLADQGSLEDAENHARRALIDHEQHAVLIQNLALVLARHPDKRADKLEEALHCCEQAEKFADFPFPHPTQLAISLRQRL
jgi:tetratricopeptide (TPR) repeat protein